jgi:hypothetical protein
MKLNTFYTWAVCILTAQFSFAQINLENIPLGSVSGNVETVFQYYQEDSLINAQVPPEKIGMNSFANVNYTNGNFKAGVRFESYLPALLGYPERFRGSGIGYRYAGYSGDKLDVTVGNFYDQFGSGMIFRAFEERQLGIDNAMDGVHLKYRPYKGIELKGFVGKQRYEFDSRIVHGPGTIRGIDGNISLSQLIARLDTTGWNITVGGSFVSKYQQDLNTQLILPENVAAYSGRFHVGYGNFYVEGEAVIKENDPSQDNGYIYKKGHGILFSAGYSRKGLGILFQAKSIDNMSFRSDRNGILSDLQVNFLPALTKTHTYNLVATLYPYATILQGEVAYQLDVMYKIPKKTVLGGKYGTKISLNAAVAYDINRQDIENDPTLRGYTATPFDMNTDSIFFSDINIEISKKFNKKWSMVLTYYNQVFNAYANVVTDKLGYIRSNIVVADVTYKIKRKHSIRGELQGLFTPDDQGDWATAILEYTISPNWTFGGVMQWNYGNPVAGQRALYPLGVISYVTGPTRFMLNVGKQRAGLFCVGGVCRQVPASNGFTFSFTHSF